MFALPIQAHTSIQLAYLMFVRPEITNSALKAISCNYCCSRRVKLYPRGAVGTAEVLLMSVVCQSCLRRKPMSCTVDLSTAIDHLGSEAGVFSYSTECEIASFAGST
jgi:hypothetical protein